jgi:hypothetical protein
MIQNDREFLIAFPERKLEAYLFSGKFSFVDNPTKRLEFEAKDPHFPFYSPDKMLKDLMPYLMSVYNYYKNIDNNELDKVKDLFAKDIFFHLFSSVDGKMYSRSSGTVYRRCDNIYDNKQLIDSFYSPNGRSLIGKHTINTMIAGLGLVYVFGEFVGNSDVSDLDIAFSDIWHFNNSGEKVVERRTYLLPNSSNEFVDILLGGESCEMGPLDYHEEMTTKLEIINEGKMMWTFNQCVGGSHFGLNRPDLSTLIANFGEEQTQIYVNKFGKLIN